MTKLIRVSVTLEEPTYKKLIKLQAKKIKKTKQGCSFSKIMNLVLENGIKNKKNVTFQK